MVAYYIKYNIDICLKPEILVSIKRIKGTVLTAPFLMLFKIGLI